MFGTLMTVITLALFVFCTFTFAFVKRNRFFGIRTKMTLMSDDIWRKAHIAAAISAVPFDIILFLILIKVKAEETKLWLSLFSIMIWTVAVLIITQIIIRNDIKNEKEKHKQNYHNKNNY